MSQKGFDSRLVEAVEILRDVWNQFAYTTNNPNARDGKWHGGLSTLEWVDEFLGRWDSELDSLRQKLRADLP